MIQITLIIIFGVLFLTSTLIIFFKNKQECLIFLIGIKLFFIMFLTVLELAGFISFSLVLYQVFTAEIYFLYLSQDFIRCGGYPTCYNWKCNYRSFKYSGGFLIEGLEFDNQNYYLRNWMLNIIILLSIEVIILFLIFLKLVNIYLILFSLFGFIFLLFKILLKLNGIINTNKNL